MPELEKPNIRRVTRKIRTWICSNCGKEYVKVPDDCPCTTGPTPVFDEKLAPLAFDLPRRTYKIKKNCIYDGGIQLNVGDYVSLVKNDEVTIDMRERGLMVKVASKKRKKKKKVRR